MNPDSVFSKDYQSKPYWWERTPRPSLKPLTSKRNRVLVVGSGYTAEISLQISRNGLETLVLDAEDAGWGGSSRNGGQISTSLKPGFDVLSAKFGAEKARAILKEGIRSLDWIGKFIEKEKIDCDFQRVDVFTEPTPQDSSVYWKKNCQPARRTRFPSSSFPRRSNIAKSRIFTMEVSSTPTCFSLTRQVSSGIAGSRFEFRRLHQTSV